jgi:uncharacterized protein
MSIAEIKEKIAPILKEYGVKKASVFGSVSRGDDRPDSDVDLLVELGPDSMGMFKYMRFIGEMEDRLGRKVDLMTNGTGKFLMPYITKDLKTIYEG